MRKQKRSMLVLAVITAFIAMGLFVPGLVGAGDLDPTEQPGPTMHTLDEIYDLIEQRCPPSLEGGVPKTGQTTSDATGDDGDLEKGVAWPNPRFTDNEDGTVTDNLTGLIWLNNANRFGQSTWSQALADCNSLAVDGSDLTDGSIAGDWRLPNIRELHSLIDFGNYGPALPGGHPFTNVQSYYYWSSTTYENNSDHAWNVFMGNGSVYHYDKSYYYYDVWPVRGGD